MKILVLSDSHSGLSFMRRCVQVLQPQAMIHLGDHYDDGQTLSEEFPHIPMYQVPGNCDLHRGYIPDGEIRLLELRGVRIYMTHGHRHGVKQTLIRLLSDARAAGAQVALYGHTHQYACFREEDGLWVLNPGVGGSWGGSCGILELQDGAVVDCRIVKSGEI